MVDCPPILFLVFNRPEKTARIFETIRNARPKRLYVAADGPRSDRPGEARDCTATRAVIETVDWECTVNTLFRDTNLGCRNAVTEGITWFFDQEPEGIVIEDDIELHPSFFSFASEMLTRFRNDTRVMSITACNMQPPEKTYAASYYFSAYNHVWGWASWARAWKLYDRTLEDLDSPECTAAIEAMCPVPGGVSYWKRALHGVRTGQIDTWDYSWLYTQWKFRGVTVTPSVNMMRNIGFDASGTHTRDPNSYEASLRAFPLSFPLRHPDSVSRDADADAHVSQNVFGIRPTPFLRRLNRWRKGDRYAWL
jgi:hypothetical protein